MEATKMKGVRNLAKFFCFWLLVLLYGLASLFYMIGMLFLRRIRPPKGNGNPSESEVLYCTPPLLSDPCFGRHKFVKLQGLKLHYIEGGDPANPLLILIHGCPGFWFCWRKQIPFLSNHFWVVALDLRGCGDSEVPKKRSAYKTRVIIRDIALLIKILDKKTAHLVFNETGCNIGWCFAAAYPSLVSKIVYINCPHPHVVKELFQKSLYHYIKYWYLLFMQLPILPEMFISDKSNSMLDLLGINSAKGLTKDEEEAYKYNFSRREDWFGVLHHLRQVDICPWLEVVQPPLLDTPTLLMIGSYHPFISREAAYRSAELVERIKIKVIEGGKTSLQMNHARIVNEEIFNFLKPIPTVAATPVTPNGPLYKNSIMERVIGVVKGPYAMLTT